MNTLLEPAVPLLESPASIGTQRIVLIGFMGAGKSTLGRLLADALQWDFVDTDADVEQRHGSSISRMFAEEGEPAFRRRESSAIARALGRRQVVIALGGGAPEILTNRLLLEQTASTAVMYLEAPLDVLLDRCILQGGASIRPVLLNEAVAAERFHLRAPVYRRCAKYIIRTRDLTPEKAVKHMLAALGGQQDLKNMEI